MVGSSTSSPAKRLDEKGRLRLATIQSMSALFLLAPVAVLVVIAVAVYLIRRRGDNSSINAQLLKTHGPTQPDGREKCDEP